ncbi:MAG: hypothetical protein H7836_06485 [Magnetococcus sp. YQC-3]
MRQPPPVTRGSEWPVTWFLLLFFSLVLSHANDGACQNSSFMPGQVVDSAADRVHYTYLCNPGAMDNWGNEQRRAEFDIKFFV